MFYFFIVWWNLFLFIVLFLNFLQNILSECDVRGGTFDYNGFCNVLAKCKKSTTGEKDLAEAFSLFDKDGKGVIKGSKSSVAWDCSDLWMLDN